MIQVEYLLTAPSGLHARPASELAKLSRSFSCAVYLVVNEQRFLAKSALSIMSGAIEPGKTVRIEADGADEKECVAAIVQYLDGVKD